VPKKAVNPAKKDNTISVEMINSCICFCFCKTNILKNVRNKNPQIRISRGTITKTSNKCEPMQ
jgi:hypothetical protein